MFGSAESSFCHGVLLAGVAPPPQAHRIQAALSCIEIQPCLFGSSSSVGERIAPGLGLMSDLLVSVLGDVEDGLPAGSFGGVVGDSSLCLVEFAADCRHQGLEPVRNHGSRNDQPGRREFVSSVLLGEGAALGDGRDVGSVKGDDSLEDITSFSDVVGLGDDTDLVAAPAPCGADVQAAAGRRRGDEGNGGGDGVGLVAVLGGRVAESDVFGDVVGRQGDVAVFAWWDTVSDPSALVGRDRPRVAIADRFS